MFTRPIEVPTVFFFFHPANAVVKHAPNREIGLDYDRTGFIDVADFRCFLITRDIDRRQALREWICPAELRLDGPIATDPDVSPTTWSLDCRQALRKSVCEPKAGAYWGYIDKTGEIVIPISLASLLRCH